MQIEHFILAKESSIDQERNSLSIFDMIEDIQIQAAQPTAAIPLGMQAIAGFRREAEQGEITSRISLRVLRPDGEMVFNKILPFQMKPEHRRFRIRMNLGFLVTTSGEYRFIIDQDGSPQTRREVVLGIHVAPAANQPLAH